MANEEQLAILKQGVAVWNQWRQEHEDAQIDLFEADLKGASLKYANLRGAYLTRANLSYADLSHSTFSGAFLAVTNFNASNLYRANFGSATLGSTELQGANLKHALFTNATLKKVNLHGANFKKAMMGTTTFVGIDLMDAIGLEDIDHIYPSYISLDTIQLSKGNIPETFLRGCGLPDWEIESSKLYNPDLRTEEIDKILYRIYDLRATQAIQINPLFISYSHGDTVFVDRMDKALTEKGVRFWRDTHEMVAGRMEKQVDLAIRQNPTFLLVLSKNSLQSDWVEHEVNEARKVEKELGRDVLCPVALDDSWKSSKWEERVMEQIMKYNILDFSKWEDKSVFEEKFAKLLSGLDLFYKKPEG